LIETDKAALRSRIHNWQDAAAAKSANLAEIAIAAHAGTEQREKNLVTFRPKINRDGDVFVLRRIESSDGFIALRSIGLDAQNDAYGRASSCGVGSEQSGRDGINDHCAGGNRLPAASYDRNNRIPSRCSCWHQEVDLRRGDEKERGWALCAAAIYVSLVFSKPDSELFFIRVFRLSVGTPLSD
jgi:hypothetical protein